MLNSVAPICAALLYCASAALLLRAALCDRPAHRGLLFTVLAVAFALHSASAWAAVFGGGALNLSLVPMLLLVSWLITAIAIGSLVAEPVENLLALLLPLDAAVLVAAALLPGHHPAPPLHPGISLHILSSILGYSILCLTALQSIMLGLQERLLKSRRHSALLEALPPLQTMERLLFQGIWIGMALLTLSIASGAWFIENLFAQHLVHKTVFSIAAWLIFAVLLLGRHRFGWRGTTAVRWTLWGVAALALAFIGTQVVRELILHRA